MKIRNRQPVKTADFSASRNSAWSEFWKMVLAAIVLLCITYFLLSFTVDLAVSQISFKTEAKIFNTLPIASMSMAPPVEDPNLVQAQSILDRFIASEKVPPLPYSLIVLDMDEPNAFAFPGGTIGLTRGLMDKLDDEIELAFVLGHELGHFHNRDHLKGLGRSAGFGIVLMAMFGTSSGADYLGNIMNAVFERKYSQDREKLADRFGIELVQAVYGRTDGVDHLFEIFREMDDIPEWGYMFTTHPSPESRIRELEEWVRPLTPGPLPRL